MSTGHEYFTVRPLQIEDAAALASMLRIQPPEYAHFFHAFAFDVDAIAKILSERQRDYYAGIFWQGELVGFFMLRGWDKGYEVPSYGVLIDARYSGYGLARLSLKITKSICRLRRVPRIMLKVHPDNLIAKTLFEEAHFIHTGVAAESGNLVYHFDVGAQSKKS